MYNVFDKASGRSTMVELLTINYETEGSNLVVA
jgi:hypothetical protein